MKTFKKCVLSVMLFFVAALGFSQGKISGRVVDGSDKKQLPGATVKILGTKSASSTGFDGQFTLNSNAKSGQVVISYIGYASKTISFDTSDSNLGTIELLPNENQLDVIVVKSTVVDIAKDRKTPVAVSTIRAADIQQKLGNLEFPEVLANTPSVYTSKAGGGFGDSRINIRGFDQRNIAVMINGVPVNDMENSAVFWSNWAGLSDVTSFMQVQRGLGSSKLAISSVGGTINVVTKTSDLKQGGSISTGVANDDYLKTGVSYNTGKMKNGFSASLLLSQTRGNTYADGTKFEAGNYYFALGYEKGKHNFQYTFTGAPQWHNQRSTSVLLSDYIKYGDPVNNEPNIKYNADWGYLNGKEFAFRSNYYHKPVMSFNWDYKINNNMKLSTVVYGSWGRGAGGNGTGAIRGNQYNNNNLRRPDGTINVDLIQSWNSGRPVSIPGTVGISTRALTAGSYQNVSANTNNLTNGISKISSFNSHDWYGGVVNLNSKVSKNLTVDFGIDARTYRGIHYQNLNELLGASNYKDVTNVVGGIATAGNINNPNTVTSFEYATRSHLNPFFNTDYQKKINFNNDSKVNWLGVFTQAEYSSGNVTAFVQGAVSQQGFKRIDYFKYLESDPLSSTDFKNILGGNIKGGLNYNIDEHQNVFVNAGYYSKQPNFSAIFPNNASKINENLTNEKIIGFEAGYGFKTKGFNANLNVYRTKWKDRYQRTNDADPLNLGGYYDFAGISEIHQGVELEFSSKPINALSINGMVSFGDWFYDGDITSNRFDLLNNNISGGTVTNLYLDKVKVGNTAQIVASLGATYELVKRVKFDANYRFHDRLFGGFNPTTLTNQVNKGVLQLPSYGLMDAGFSYKMLVGRDKGDSINFRFNLNNVLNTIYISESSTNVFADDYVTGTSGPTYESAGRTYNGVANNNRVFFGFGRTWNVTLTYNFK